MMKIIITQLCLICQFGILRLHSFKKNYPCLPLFIYKCCSDVYYNYYQWTFEKLQNLLRMNFTFSEFNIKDLSRSCRKGNTSVSDFGTRSKHFTLCGKHAQFLYYSSKPKVTISTKVSSRYCCRDKSQFFCDDQKYNFLLLLLTQEVSIF